MFSLGYNLLMAAKVILLFTLFYIFIPAQIIRFKKEANQFLDKVFISLTHSTIITILIVHVLAFLKLYEFFSLVFCYLLSYIILVWLRGQSLSAVADAMGMKFVVNLLDLSEGRAGLIGEVKKGLKEWIRAQKDNVLQMIKKAIFNPFTGLLPVGILMAAAYIRFENPISHAAFSHIDSYVHLLWTKSIGSNEIYNDGIYPFGSHAVISSLAKITFIDPYWLCRFLGPLTGVLLVLSVYYFALRVTQSYAASLISLVVYGLVTHAQFPAVVFRQTAALSQEFGAVFMLPGLYFFWLYIKTKKRSFLLLYAEALAITIMVHPYVTFYLTIWVAIMAVSAIVLKMFSLRDVANVTVYSILTGIVSLLPFGIGLLMGKEFFKDSAKYIQENISPGGFAGSSMKAFITNLVTHNPFLDISLPIVFLLIISLTIIRKREWALISLTVAGCSVIMYLLYRAPEFNLPVFTEPVRTGIFFSPMLAVLYASGFAVVERCFLKLPENLLQPIKGSLVKSISLILCIMVVYYYPPVKLYRGIEEYDAAAENYLNIRNKFPPLEWTVVGPQEQYAQTKGMGWHYQILRFVQNFNVKQAQDPQFQIPITTPHIFFYTEKRPLRLGREVTAADAEMELEPEGDDPFIQYYKTTSQRAILEAKAIRWMEAYKESHKGVTVFYEDDNMRIYHIYQEPVK